MGRRLAEETVGDTNFDKVYRAKVGIGVESALEDVWQRSTELDGFGESKAERLGVDLGEREVCDCPGPTAKLRGNAHRTKSEMLKTANALVGRQDPLSFLHHLDNSPSRKSRCGDHVPRRHRSKQSSRGRGEHYIVASAA